MCSIGELMERMALTFPGRACLTCFTGLQFRAHVSFIADWFNMSVV